MSNKDLIAKFYTSFGEKNIAEMLSCYSENIEFEDPAFGKLIGKNAKDMWKMLLENNKNEIKIVFNNIETQNDKGSANWQATYIFSLTGNKVINNIKAKFEFKDGKIIKHTDYFDVWKWSSQALGWKGYLLGWTPFMKNKIQQQSNQLLKKYQQKMV